MLTNVPIAINSMMRNVIIHHPNTFNCQLFRKVVTRTAPETVGGLPTLGGMGVLDSSDEEQYDYDCLGMGYALPAEGFAPAPMVKRGDASIGSGEIFRFVIVSEEPHGHADWFEPRRHDIVYLYLGAGTHPAKLAFEITGEETTSNIPPFTIVHTANRRDDLHVQAGAP